MDASINSTNNINTASDGNNTNNVNAVSSTVNIVYSNNDEDVGAKADINNLDAFIIVSPIPTTRIHKDHRVEQIIGDLNSAPQTRRMTKNLKEHGLFSSVQQRTNHKDFQNCLFACFLSQEEPKKIIQALKDPSWIEAMQDELLQFKLQKNKARLVAQGYTQEQGIMLAYASFKDFVYQKGQKTASEAEERWDFFSQDKYVTEILKKFGFTDVKTASTLIETHKLLLKNADGEEVDEHMYRSMIGSLMYLTSSRPDIMFAVCACARYQINPKVLHHAVKRIFRYLKGQPKLGLWYPKDSPFDLEAYTDSDYAGASLDRKSTTGGIRVNAGDSKLMLLGINVLLLVFWATAKVKTVNGEVQLQALVDGKKVIIIETSVRRDLQLEDAEGIACLPNADIFEQLALMGYEKPSQKLTFYKAFFSPQWKFLIHTILQCLNKQVGDMSTHDEILVTPSHIKKIFGNMKRIGKGFSGAVTPLFPTMMVQAYEEMGEEPIVDEAVNEENVPTQSNDPPISRVNILGSGEDILTLKELMYLCTKLSDRVLDLQTTKTAQAKEITSLTKRVKKLERKRKLKNLWMKRLFKIGRSSQVVSSEDEGLGDQEDASKQGRKIDDIDQDVEVTLVNETQGKYDDVQMFDTDIFNVSVAATITTEEITLAQALAELRSAKPKIVNNTKMIEPEKPLKMKEQIRLDEELAFKLQAEEEEQERLAREKAEKVEEANIS
ncbi:hypothetical protein Tco_0153616 [Tanacetum coccineum]